MTEKKLLDILSFLLALIGGILVLAGVLIVSGSTKIDLAYLGKRAVPLILGIAAILCGAYMFKGHINTGGLLTIVVGVLIAVDQGSVGLEGALVILGGVLGIITAEARSLPCQVRARRAPGINAWAVVVGQRFPRGRREQQAPRSIP